LVSTCGVLAQVALGPAACFAAFDDLLALTVRTDGDKDEPALALDTVKTGPV
jgi:hypothetical protein